MKENMNYAKAVENKLNNIGLRFDVQVRGEE